MYDAIVVGARCAGSPTAMLLARKGYRVLLVDSARFPSDTMSTHALKVAAAARLERWGLLDRIADTNCPAILRGTLDFGPLRLSGSAPPLDDVSVAYCVRRTLLDKILVDAAVEAGAELREGFRVTELTSDDGRVTGISGNSNLGVASEEARIVIGADGLHSVVARSVQAPSYEDRGTLTCGYYSYWANVPIDGVEFYPRERRSVIAFPTNDNLTVIYTAWPAKEFYSFRSDPEGNYFQTIAQMQRLFDRAREGTLAEQIVGTVDLPNVFRRPYGPGWALVGDAGYHKDPITAQGITDAFRDAELLADAVDDGLSGRQPLDEALAGYEQARNEASMPVFDFICQQAALEPPSPEMQQLFSALAGNQPQIDRLVGVIENTVPVQDFFSPENIGSIIATAGR
jgi:flavin-dependent dehydrogenase